MRSDPVKRRDAVQITLGHLNLVGGMPPSAASKGSRAAKAAAKTSKATKSPKPAKKRPEKRPAAKAAKDPKAAKDAGTLSKNGGAGVLRGRTGVLPRRKYRPFSDEESKALIVGVKRYGLGNWTRIHDDPDLPFMVRAPACRWPSSAATQTELKSVRANAVDTKNAYRPQGQMACTIQKAVAGGSASCDPI